MDMTEIKELDRKAAQKKLQELDKELFDYKFSKSTSGIEKPHLMKMTKKTIARVKTHINTLK